MKRRTFVAGLAATVGVSRISFAQTGQVPEIVLFYAGPVASAEARAKLIREALNADGFVGRSDEQICSTLAHGLCHLWQHVYGTPPSRGYHDREWSMKMRTIGLMPSSTGDAASVGCCVGL